MNKHYEGLISRFRSRLPKILDDNVVSLSEGNTPLIRIKCLKEANAKGIKIYAKFEGLNPTGSFKDRGMTVAVSNAISKGAKAIICASTGNTSAAAAAYAARAGIKSFVLIPDGKIAFGKLSQAMMHGSTVIQIDGNFDDGLKLVKTIGEEFPVEIVNSSNPYRLQGQKTISFEVIDELGFAPDYHALPVGNAGNISAHWMGYLEACGSSEKMKMYKDYNFEYNVKSFCKKTPKIIGYQAKGSAPFMRKKILAFPETIATAIRIGNPVSWNLAWSAVEESNGWFNECSDEYLLEMQKYLAEKEGIFCEPASAVAVAGLKNDIEQNLIKPESTVVCTLTGHGLKDPDIAIKRSGKPFKVEAQLIKVEKILKNFI